MMLSLLVACGGKQGQEKSGLSGKLSIEEALSEADTLKGEEIPLDTTVLFRYAYRFRVMGDRVVVWDLHNADYYFHLFTYPQFEYISSFGKRGEGPEESISSSEIRFLSPDTVWALDNIKGRMFCYSGITGNQTPKLEKDVLLDERVPHTTDFDLKDPSTIVAFDHSGKHRFAWMKLPTGELLSQFEQIPTSQTELLENNAPAVSQGWYSYISLTPDKKKLVTATQLGDRLDIYDLENGTNVNYVGPHGEPQFGISGGYGYPTGRKGYNELQVTDKYIYTVYDGREFKEIIKDPDNYLQGGLELRVFNHQGELVKISLFDRYISGVYVDEARGLLFATDVNADEQLIKYHWKL